MGLFKTYSEKEVKRVRPIVEKINSLEPAMKELSDSELVAKTPYFKEQLKNGKTLDDILPEAFAVVREASRRVLGMRHFDVQLIGGIILHQGRIAEMKTGEGKTLVATLPVYLNALTGRGVHVITVNDYLAKRDSEWMGKLYKFMGLSVGLVIAGMDPKAKQKAYACDITYGTNNEFGFDYLRDNMVIYKEQLVQRDLAYAIVDEIDSILIDEARTPLIISGRANQSSDLYKKANDFVKRLTPKIIVEEDVKDEAQAEDNEKYDYIVDLKAKSASLTQKGIKKAEEAFHLENFNDIENSTLVHHVNQALRAHGVMKKDIDYIVKDGEVLIVDEFTGRIMYGRRYNNGLHQAIEAKEGVKIADESKTLATITFQNYFRMYDKLSGMTGTAMTEEAEFEEIYNLDVISIPTNKPMIRKDNSDIIYKNEDAKFRAVIADIKKAHEKGQPVLIGTVSIDKSEKLSKLLDKEGIPHEVLNAKYHEKEAQIIAQAGKFGAVTIATNMAGRGTDIKLGEGVREIGGLYVIGTERHESRRIDNQLRGRSGRQGDPGTSQFFVSFEDDLMRRFGTEKIKNMLISMGIDDDQAIRSKALTRSIESAQKKVEGNNFDYRKSLLDYDNVLNEQREIIYAKRNEILDNESIHDKIIETFKNTITNLVDSHITPENMLTENDLAEIAEYVNTNFLKNQDLNPKALEGMKEQEVIDYLSEQVIKDYEKKMISSPLMNDFEKAISLRVIDTSWVDHMSAMEHLKEGVGLRGYGQSNPVQVYTMEGFEMFDNLLNKIDNDIALFLLKAEVRQNIERKQTLKGTANDGKEKLKKEPKRVSHKIGRNDPCICGSGKKYKNCCGK